MITAKVVQNYLNPWTVKDWQPMVFIGTAPDEYSFHKDAIVDVWQNDIYTCHKRILGDFYHMRIFRHDLKPVHEWRHLQQIKNDIAGNEFEAVELYPAMSRIVDTSNSYHLWILRSGKQFPFGIPLRQVRI